MHTREYCLYGLCYGDKTTPFTKIDMQGYVDNKWRFENNVLLNFCESDFFNIIHRERPEYMNSKFFGFFSWKFRQKTGLTVENVTDCLHKWYISNIEVINFSPDLGRNIRGFGNFMDWSDKGHIGIKSMVERCCKHVGMVYKNNPDTVVYANLFAARYYVYKDYVETVIKPCLELLEGEMWEEVNREAGYTAGLEKEELKRLTGLDFYNYVPFILERMMMQYIHNKGIKVVSV